MIVMKFGGTSVGSPEAIRRVGEIIRSRQSRNPLIVVSAVAKTTDKLISLGEAASRGETEVVTDLIDEIVTLHQHMIADLGLGADEKLQAALKAARKDLSGYTDNLLQGGRASKQIQDAISSTGEFLSSNMLARYLSSVGIDAGMADAREIVVTDSQFGSAIPQVEESTARARAKLLPYLESAVIPVMQGFIGRNQDGLITTLGRGGSDYSATLIAAMLQAEAVEIWTDVDGVMTADPTLVREVKRIRRMTFQEAAELAYFGARVLHPATILPAVERGIPVYVYNTMRPNDSGTEILPVTTQRKSNGSLVKSIAYKEGLSIVTIKSTRMLMAYGFMASIFDIFNKYKTPVDLVSTSEVSVSITVDRIENLDQILQELNRFAETDVQHGKAVVCVVGENIRKIHGMPAQIFETLKDKEIHLISQGASEINISFVIDESEIGPVINRLHDKFFTGPLNEEIFATTAAST